jgi:hypothetical protein
MRKTLLLKMTNDLMPNERYAETEEEEIQAELNEELSFKQENFMLEEGRERDYERKFNKKMILLKTLLTEITQQIENNSPNLIKLQEIINQ